MHFNYKKFFKNRLVFQLANFLFTFMYFIILVIKSDIFLGGVDGSVEPALFAGSWPLFIYKSIPFFSDEIAMMAFLIFLFIACYYWYVLIKLINRKSLFLLGGIIFHLLGGCVLVYMYNKDNNGVPLQYFYRDSIFGGMLSLAYLLLMHGIYKFNQKFITKRKES